MTVDQLSIPDVLPIKPQRRGDERGWFSETFRQSALDEAGFRGGRPEQGRRSRLA